MGDVMANTEFSRLFSQENFPSLNGFLDFNAVMEAQRKNIEAFTEAQQLAFEGIQAVAQRQAELLTRIVQDNSTLAREIMGDSTPEQKVARQADLMKKTYESSVESFRELSDMISKCGTQASDVLTKRVSASFTEVKSALEKTAKQQNAARQKAAA